MSTDEPTGVDLARVALAAEKKAAKERGVTTSAKRTVKRRASARGTGRDPMGLGGALAQLVAERGWETPVAGGSVKDQWKTIATPEVADNLRAVAFDKNTGRLDLVPATNAWVTQARLISAELIRQANAAARTEAVRQIRVLPVGTRTSATSASAPAPPAPAPHGEVRTHETASPGYHRARAAIGIDSALPPAGPVHGRDDGCDGYQEARALLKTPPAPPTTKQEPVRTRDDGCEGYREAIAQVSAPAPTRSRSETQIRTRETASTGYQLARRTFLDGKSRGRARPT